MPSSSNEDLPKVLSEYMLSDPASAFESDMLDRLVFAYLDSPKVWQQCKRVLKQHAMVRDVESRVKLMAREARGIPSIGGPPPTEPTIGEVWPQAPVTDNVYVPDGYSIQDTKPAIQRLENKMVQDMPYERRLDVCIDPVVITRRIGHMQTRGMLLELAFRTDRNRWHKIVVDRDIAMSARKVLDTAKLGMPVSAGNALELTEWFRHYEADNRESIPIGYASSSMGWQGGDDTPTHHGFMCGRRQIGGNGRAIELEGSDGDMLEARELRSHGEFESWCSTIQRLVHFPSIRLAICAALAPPLIAILEAPNGIIEWAGRTSTGKSTVLQVAQSCWRSATNRLATWNSTIIGVEAYAQFFCDLPLFIDDTSAAVEGGRSQNLSKVIYQIVSGRARGRATRDGGQKIRSRWRTIVLSSGETPLGELARAEGASARVLTFWSAPLGETSAATAVLFNDAMHELGEHYGHAGPRFVQWLCNNQDQWDQLRILYREVCSLVRKTICTPAASRLAEIIGILDCAAYVGRVSGVLPWAESLVGDPEIRSILLGSMTLASQSSDQAYSAWEYVLSEANMRPKSWIGWGTSVDGQERDPPGGWLGYKAANEFAWFPSQLRRSLIQGGFTPDAVLRAWKDLGVLISPERSRYTSQCRPGPMLDRSKIRLIRAKTSYPGHEDDTD